MSSSYFPILHYIIEMCLLSYILHSSNTWLNMGIQWGSAAAIYRLQEANDLVMRDVLYYIISSLSLVSLWNQQG